MIPETVRRSSTTAIIHSDKTLRCLQRHKCTIQTWDFDSCYACDEAANGLSHLTLSVVNTVANFCLAVPVLFVCLLVCKESFLFHSCNHTYTPRLQHPECFVPVAAHAQHHTATSGVNRLKVGQWIEKKHSLPFILSLLHRKQTAKSAKKKTKMKEQI